MLRRILAAYLSVLIIMQPIGCAHGLGGGSASSSTHSERLRSQLADPDGAVLVVAHRGCWHLAPENSIQSVEKCIQIDVDMVEVDVRRSRDGHLVVIHDDSVNRTTNGHGLVADLTLNELKQLNLRTGAGGEGAALTNQRIPTLRQVLQAAAGRVLVNLDAKADIRDDAYRLAKEVGVSDQILIKMSLSSPDDAALRETAFFGNTFFMPILREENGNLARQVGRFDETDPVAFELIYRSVSQLADACDAAAAQKARCWVNTMWEELSPGHTDEMSVLDPDRHWGFLTELGVDMIQTDRPQELIAYLASKGLRAR